MSLIYLEFCPQFFISGGSNGQDNGGEYDKELHSDFSKIIPQLLYKWTDL